MVAHEISHSLFEASFMVRLARQVVGPDWRVNPHDLLVKSCSSRSSGSKVGSWIFRFYKVVPPRKRSVGEHNSNFTMVYGTQITIVFMGFINQQTSLGGPTLYECLGTSWTLRFSPLDSTTSTVTSQRRLRCSDARGCASVASFQPWCGHLQGNREVLPAGSEGNLRRGGFAVKVLLKKL